MTTRYLPDPRFEKQCEKASLELKIGFNIYLKKLFQLKALGLHWPRIFLRGGNIVPADCEFLEAT